MTDPRLQLRDLRVVFDGVTVVTDATVTVDAGEFVAVLGANGSGKSTLVRAAMGLVPVASGSARLFGVPQRSFHAWERIGYVPQRMSATAGVPATVAEVVGSGRLARRRLFSRWSREDRDAVREALELVDLSDRITDPISDLSGGQQQRALIARALATRPDLLVMDEPTAGVDHEHQIALSETLGSLAGQGCSVVFVTHEADPFIDHLDRALVMRDGRIVHDGPVPHLPGGHDHAHHPHSSQPNPDPNPHGEGMWR